jgi:large subunit ribosomal protein L29
MAILRPKEIRNLDRKSLEKKMAELKLELSKERANIYIGANVTSPGRINEIRKTISRINTILNEKSIREESA